MNFPKSMLIPRNRGYTMRLPLSRKLGHKAIMDGGDLNLNKLRKKMSEMEINALIIPSSDPHLSEYVAPCFERRAFISGFKGSAGTALVTESAALLWTDARYFLQAEKELSPSWTLMKSNQLGVPTLVEYIQQNMPGGGTVAMDALTHSVEEARDIETKLLESSGPNNVSIKYTPFNLVDLIWDEHRPSLPSAPIRIHHMKYAGVSASTKLEEMTSYVKKQGADMMLVCALDEIAWLLNLRGGDIPFNPVFLSYLTLGHDEVDQGAGYLATLYVDPKKLEQVVLTHLETSKVRVAAYETIEKDILTQVECGKSLCFHPSSVNHELTRKLPHSSKVLLSSSPITNAKAVKNTQECQGMKSAHEKDGAAISEFMWWLFEGKKEGEHVILDEVIIDEALTSYRQKQDGFIGLSFPTIAGVNGNGAIIHYSAEKETCSTLPEKGCMLLIDSGGQYEEGTTDVTRTLHTGVPTPFQRECFTRVLKGHIAVDEMVFPSDTPGFVLDVMARRSLWEAGLDYGHGTGHGVGAALNVHEGPIGISTRYSNMNGLKAGMIVSNEPGYYHEKSFGIRIENLLLVKKAYPSTFTKKQEADSIDHSMKSRPDKSYLKFERLTLVPIQTSLLDMSLLSPDELEWIDSYHQEVREQIMPRLEHNPQAQRWLREATEPIANTNTLGRVLKK